MEQQKFKGVVYLSKEQYDELKANGTIEIEGVTLTYEPYTTIYVTPDDDKVNQSDLEQSTNNLQTQIDEINNKKKYRHDIKSPTSHSSWECYITLITEDATPFNINTLKAYLYENYPVGVPAWSSELYKDETDDYIQYQYVYKMYGTETHLMYSSHRITFDKVLLDGTQILCSNPSIDRGTSANVGFQITDTVTEL